MNSPKTRPTLLLNLSAQQAGALQACLNHPIPLPADATLRWRYSVLHRRGMVWIHGDQVGLTAFGHTAGTAYSVASDAELLRDVP